MTSKATKSAPVQQTDLLSELYGTSFSLALQGKRRIFVLTSRPAPFSTSPASDSASSSVPFPSQNPVF